eukprot:4264468-Amphidinium_carterae.1
MKLQHPKLGQVNLSCLSWYSHKFTLLCGLLCKMTTFTNKKGLKVKFQRAATTVGDQTVEQEHELTLIANSMLFGTTSAVYAFNRCCFFTDYFDDFPTVQCKPLPLAASSKQAFETLLGVLGWRVSDGEKSPSQVLENCIPSRSCSRKDLEALVRKLQFARGQLIGHGLVPALTMLYRRLQVSKHVIALSAQDCGMLGL